MQKEATQPECDSKNMKTPADKVNVPPSAAKGATPETAWEVGDSEDACWSDFEISFTPRPKHMAKENIGNDSDVMSGKRKRTIPKKFSSPYALDQPSRRPTRCTRPSGSTTVNRGTGTIFPSALFVSNTCNLCR